jgi:hypothetical protein
LYFFSVTGILSKPTILSHIRIWDSTHQTFSSPQDIWLEQGKIQKIQISKSDTSSKRTTAIYALPGFCDAYTTLGVNPWGGESSVDLVKIGLNSILSAGFTHIESIGDGLWVGKIQNYIDKKQWKGPIILQSSPPIVSPIESSIPSTLYQTVTNDKELENALKNNLGKKNHIFHRNEKSYVPDLRFLFHLRANSQFSKNWVLHTFADSFSSQEAMATEWEVIFHPIHTQTSEFQLRKVRWSPLMAIYYFQSRRNAKDWDADREKFLKRSPLFKITYEEISKSFPENFILSELESKQAKDEYQMYLNEFIERKILTSQLIFGSGTGYPLVYPGMGAWQELRIWEKVLSEQESQKIAPSSDVSIPKTFMDWWLELFSNSEEMEISSIKKDSEKIPSYRKMILRSITENTCGFIGASHLGKIQESKEANFNLYQKNPLAEDDGFLFPYAVYQKGILVSGSVLK